jgi:O-antigen ligase
MNSKVNFGLPYQSGRSRYKTRIFQMNLVSHKKFNGELVLRRAGIIALALFSLIIFESKALINLIGGLSLLLSFSYIYIYDRKILHKNRYLLIFIVPFILGFLLSFLSLSGAAGAFAFLDRFKFMLLAIPLVAFVQNRKDLNILLTMFFLSATVAVCYGIYDKQPYAMFHGIYKIGRTADMMMVACLAAFVYLVQSRWVLNIKSIGFKFLMAFAAVFFAWAVMMSEMRGSWLGLGVGFISFICVLLVSHRKMLVFNALAVIFIMFSVIFFGNNTNRITGQFESIVETQNNASNEARLHLWKTGWDFSKDHFVFGTGAKQSEEPFIEFFNAQPEDYRNKYHYAINYAGEYHNSYMQIHIETGIVFLLVYVLSIIYLLFVILKNIRRVQLEDQKYLIAAVIASVAFLVTQIFHNDLYYYGSTAFYLVLFSGCYVLNQDNHLAWFGKGHKNEI